MTYNEVEGLSKYDPPGAGLARRRHLDRSALRVPLEAQRLEVRQRHGLRTADVVVILQVHPRQEANQLGELIDEPFRIVVEGRPAQVTATALVELDQKCSGTTNAQSRCINCVLKVRRRAIATGAPILSKLEAASASCVLGRVVYEQ
ncbi:hypothetical protein [Enhygromyxa salina]|uniref:hypothetical protein n=1 Tax=Enhygromyxa salina TaxID=215803 RepID=UPI001FD0BE8C|nr:hypothetical protein [Enhygromyxa salina]